MTEMNRSNPVPRVEELFEEALKRSESERPDYLALVCGEDASLRQRVEALLQAHGEESGFLPEGVSEETVFGDSPNSEETGAVIGRFKLLEKLGEGGFGSVWAAEQREPVKRRVALKIIKLGMDTKQVVARFEAERQALALMDHPNIAKVLDAGTTEVGRPYFVMELVRGIAITQYCSQERLSSHERLELFIKVCRALQHAHQKGIIHRDIKPSNILVTLHDGVPVPKIIDFGIAKATQQELTEKTIYTQFQQFIGTPAYMSPEQAEMSGLDIDTRSDIYSLGVLLYELLTGGTPFDTKELMASGVDQMRKMIREREPVKPSTRVSQTLAANVNSSGGADAAVPESLMRMPGKDFIATLRGDLDWIVMKCLEKDRARRYETANGLALDVQRYLSNEPVTARPPSTVYRFQKAWRRNKVAVTAGLVMAASLMVGLSVSLWKTAEARSARIKASENAVLAEKNAAKANAETEKARIAEKKAADRQAEAERRADENWRIAYASDMNQAQRSLQMGGLGEALGILDRYRPKIGAEDIRGFEWRYLWQQCRSDGEVLGKVSAVSVRIDMSVSHDGQWLFVGRGGLGEANRFFNLKTGKESWPVWAPRSAVLREFSPKTSIAAFSAKIGNEDCLQLIDIKTGDLAAELGVFEEVIWCGFSGDGAIFGMVTGKKETGEMGKGRLSSLGLWRVSEGRLVGRFSIPYYGRWGTRRAAIALSPDGRLLAVGHDDGVLQLIETSSGDLLWSRQIWSDSPKVLAFSPNAKFIAAGTPTHSTDLVIIDVDSKKVARSLKGHNSQVTSVHFTDEGRVLVSSASDQTVRRWSMETLEEIQVLRGHQSEVRNVVSIPGDGRLISAGLDGEIIVWDPKRVQGRAQYITAESPGFFSNGMRGKGRTSHWAFSSSGKSILMVDDRSQLLRLHGRGYEVSQIISQLGPDLRSVLYDANEPQISTMDAAGDVFAWQVDDDYAHRRWVLNLPAAELVGVWPDQDLLLAVERLSPLATLLMIRYSTGEIISKRELPIDEDPYVVSNDCRWLVTSALAARQRGAPASLMDLKNSISSIGIFENPRLSSFLPSISPDNRFLVFNCEPHLTRVFDLMSGKLEREFEGHLNGAKSAAFSPGSKRLVTGAVGLDAIKFWDVTTWRSLLTLPAKALFWNGIQFSADGNVLGGWASGKFHVWRAPSWKEIEAKEGVRVE